MGRRGREERIRSVESLLKQAMPPRYEAMVNLEKAAYAWKSVVGPILAKQSVMLDIVNGELLVAAENPLVGNRLTMMGGNIARALAERWGLELVKVKVVVGRFPLKNSFQKEDGVSALRPARSSAVRVWEKDIKEFESRCLESLPDFPENAAESLARLRAFFIKRFKS